MSESFWVNRDAFKSGVGSVLETLELVRDISSKDKAMTEEENIFLGQAVFWLKYLQSRHYVSDEKFIKKFPKTA